MSTEPPPAQARSKGPLPLVVGVTGHRDLRSSGDDLARLQAQVRAIFEELETHYPATPIVVLSALAEGADRLVARVALARGARLVAPLPVPRSFYQGDPEFDELIAHADWFELERAEPTAKGDAANSDARYREVGAYIVRHSQLLIALWDGEDTGKPGGTWEVVRLQLKGELEGDPVPAASIEWPETGPVFQIVTPRASNPAPGRAFALRKRFPRLASSYSRNLQLRPPARRGSINPILHWLAERRRTRGRRAAESVFERACGNLDAFNRLDTEHEAELRVERQQAPECLLGTAEGLPRSLRNLLNRFAEADYLGRRFQRSTHSTLLWLLALAMLAAILFQVHIYLLTNIKAHPRFAPWTFLGTISISVVDLPYLIFSLAVYWVYRWAEKNQLQNRYLDYRALAEGLRVQIFWRITSVTDSVSDHYLTNQKSELDWIRNAIRNLHIGSEAREFAPAAAPGPNELNLALDRWVKHQRSYYAGSARTADAKSWWINLGGQLLLFPALSLAVIKVFLPSDHPLSIGMVVFIGLAGIMVLYSRIRALAQHAKQYTKMSLVFAVAEKRLMAHITGNRTRDAQELIRALGREALVENADWVLLHRDRPLEIPRV